jgi:hypothetical protein
LIITAIVAIALSTGTVSGQSSNSLVGFFETSKTSSTFLSPSNTGTGVGVVLAVTVVNSSNWFQSRISPNNFFGKSSVTFHGKGFDATLPASGTELFTIELEGSSGLLPDMCWEPTVQQSSTTKVLDGGVSCESGGVIGGNPQNMSPLAGPGQTINETMISTYSGSAQQVDPSNNVYFSIMIGSTNSAYIGSTVFIHYGGGTTGSTSYFSIGP